MTRLYRRTSMTAPLWITGPPPPALGALRRAGYPQLLHHAMGHDPAGPAKGSGLIHHSDRGSQYVAIKYTERLTGAAARGALWKPSSSPPWNGWTGSTTGACSTPSATFLPPRPKHTTMSKPRTSPWRRDSSQMVSDKPDAVQLPTGRYARHSAGRPDGEPNAARQGWNGPEIRSLGRRKSQSDLLVRSRRGYAASPEGRMGRPPGKSRDRFVGGA